MSGKLACLLLAAAALSGSALRVYLTAAEQPPENRRAVAHQQFRDGNFREAYETFRRLAVNPDTDPLQVAGDLQQAVHCLRRLGRVDETDSLLEQAAEAQPENWRLLHQAAKEYVAGPPYGYIVGGTFHRGDRRGGGQYVGSQARDRVRALQLMDTALPTVEESDARAASTFFLDFARFLMHGRGGGNAWELISLTDLTELPDYGEGHWGRWGRGMGGSSRGAPVDAEGNPVFHQLPESYAAATTDGERWRWMLRQTAEADPGRTSEVGLLFADFLRSQFGVQTLREYAGLFTQPEDQDDDGPWSLHTLDEDETIARLASGVKRFELPDEFNFLRIYREVADDDRSTWGERALTSLADIFENRRQYPKAADTWRKNIAQYGPGPNNQKAQRLEQIVGNWGRFENISVQPAGDGATVDFRFRNGRQVTFEAWEIKIDRLLDDVKNYLKSNPAQLDWQQVQFDNFARRLVEQRQNYYLHPRMAEWNVELEPRDEHFDRRVTVSTPLKKAGAYLLTARMADGNVSRIIVWVADTVIARKQLDGRMHYFVADAVTGRPVPQAELEFFGYRQQHIPRTQPPRHQVVTTGFRDVTDADGQATPSPQSLQPGFNWIVIARTKEANGGRLAYLGFDGVWYGRRYDPIYDQNKVFVATDRPVYRPGQPVKFKFWVRKARYDQPDVSHFAGQEFTARLIDPRGETALERSFKADEYGGFDGEWTAPAGATLGQYHLHIINRNDVHGGGSFRIEEYKKPEFEVTVEAPDEPMMLGDTISATIKAKYYFGAPVVNAKVHYKVTRTPHTARWFPPGPWDWFYGEGYGWFAPDYEWYPGWRRWGSPRPVPPWWGGFGHQPPEVVLDNEVEIGPDGTVQVIFDTALAKEMHGDRDHRYEITAEVVDLSRRTIVGTGEVLVARRPFQVSAWVDRGYYRAGDTVKASFKAQTLDRKPVEGEGRLSLLRITYKDDKPVETEVATWDLPTNDRGEAQVQIKAAESGQYRLAYAVTDKQGRTIDGGYLFNVVGAGFESDEFRFNDLELVVEQREYRPGEKLRVMINTNRPGSTVLLFARPAGGVYPRPQVLRLDGKSTLHEIDVIPRDMPNFFIEAATVSDAKLHTEVREVIVPPEQRVANVEVLPSSAEYKPGEEAKLQLKLTDLEGNPFVGSTVLTVYDKSVEYIAGGTNVPDIREHFWKWRRHHHPATRTNLERWFANMLRSGEVGMGHLGAFGHLIFEADEKAKDGLAQADKQGRREMAAAGFAAPQAAAMEAMDAAPGEARGGEGQALRKNAVADRAAAPDDPSAPPPSFVEPTVRTAFADTAFWAANLTPDEDGVVEVAFTMPENLTTWKVRTWTLGHGTQVGQGEAEVVTTKNLLVRMQAPRFFIEKDEVVLSANVHNYLNEAKQARVLLELDGDTLAPLDSLERSIEIAADGEQRIDWRVRATQAGEAVVRMKALTDEESDAMEMRFPVHVHGMHKTESFTGVLRPEDEAAVITLLVPDERRPDETRLEVRFSPTLAGAMVDALPYLVDYPYGCTEQTLNRFLPTVITQRVLRRMGVDLKAVRDKRTNLNPQELGDPQVRAAQWRRRNDDKHNPVFDEAEVDRMVAAGIQRLTEMQVADGGWGWFSGYGERSYPHTTAVVVHGLQVAKENGVEFDLNMLERGLAWLKTHQAEQVRLLQNAGRRANNDDAETQKLKSKSQADNIDAFTYMVLADADHVDAEMERFLYRDRTKLSPYAMALFGLALHRQGSAEKLAMILRNLEQFLVEDDENQTAYLRLPNEGWWWRWYGHEVEANAYYLKLLAKTDPQGRKASRLVKYLLNNRKHATYWTSTRDTAYAIEALAEYLVASGETQPDMVVEVWFDGEKQKEVQIDATNLFAFDNQWLALGEAVASGVRRVELRRKGTGPLYYNAWLTNFTLEDFITRTGLEVKVDRIFYRLHRQDRQQAVEGVAGRPVEQRVERYEREPLENLATVASGDLIEVELIVESKNDYEYLIFEDKKAAGFEPVEVRSGYFPNDLGAYMELRDERVSFFVRALPRGKHSLRYRLRAEIPGRFSALPAVAYGMYAPELQGNSDEMKLSVEDKPERQE